MQVTKTTPEEFISTLPDESRDAILKIHKKISASLSKIKPVMYEGKFWGGSEQKIIGYGDFKYKGKSGSEGTWFIAGLAQQKNYITVFINAYNGKAYLTDKYKGKLGNVKVGKSTITFKKLEDVNLEQLTKLIKEGYLLMTKK